MDCPGSNDFLTSPTGIALAQALTLALVSLSAYLNWRIHSTVGTVAQKLDDKAPEN